MATLTHVEAHLDFPDEDLAPDDQAALGSRLDEAVQHLDELLRTAHDGQVLRRGVRAAIVGRPNVGKSSLLNRLLDRDRAIVSPVPGTTRDTIEETADVRGIPVVFVDTAGLRETADAVEGEGVRRSRQALDRSELVLHVLDGSEPLAPEDDRLLKVLGGRKRLLIRNKVDLPVRLCLPERVTPPPVDVSCTNGSGIDRLKDAIQAEVWGGGVGAGMLQVMINSRHQEALQRARAAAARAREALGAGVALDLVSLDLRVATGAVGEVVGQTSVEDLLDAVFARFCIGK
jgi:tRNA modification GTPase